MQAQLKIMLQLGKCIDDLANDMKVTPSEKTILSREWESIKAEYTQVLAQATSLGVATSTYTTSYTNLDGVTPKIAAEVLASMTSTYTFASTSTRDTFRAKINVYFSESEKIKKAINDKALSNSKDYALDLKTKDYGYRYKTDVVIKGDPNLYYPVIIKSGNQTVMREILVNRSYGELAPQNGITLLTKAD